MNALDRLERLIERLDVHDEFAADTIRAELRKVLARYPAGSRELDIKNIIGIAEDCLRPYEVLEEEDA